MQSTIDIVVTAKQLKFDAKHISFGAPEPAHEHLNVKDTICDKPPANDACVVLDKKTYFTLVTR